MGKPVIIKDGDHLAEVTRALPGKPCEGLPFLTEDDRWQQVARYEPSSDDGDGVTVYVHRMPTAFYRIVGDRKGVDLSTGAGPGVEDLVHVIATAITEGILGLTDEPAGQS
jgi:hypothetical protein